MARAQNANAPTPIGDPLHEPPAARIHLQAGTPVRRWHPQASPSGSSALLMVFFIGVLPHGWPVIRPRGQGGDR